MRTIARDVAALFPLAACLAMLAGCSSDNAKGSGDVTGTGGNQPTAGDGGGGGAGGTSPAGGSGGTIPVAGTGGSGGGNTGGTGGRDLPEPTREPVEMDWCAARRPSGLSDEDVQTLMDGGDAADMRWLYPYDGTVFPRGTRSPMLMWEGPAADAVYLHLKSSLFDFKGCFAPDTAGQLRIPQEVWDKAGAQTQGQGDPFTVELTALSGSNATGPITEAIVIAQATLKGSIYYNSYSSQLAAMAGGTGGAVLRIPPGGSAEVFLGQNGCTGCHSVSADGSRLLSAPVGGGAIYDVGPQTPTNPEPLRDGATAVAFSGVYPDGSLYLTTAHPLGAGTRPASAAPAEATLIETDTGSQVSDTGIPTGAMTPMFSPDGNQLVFNDYAINQGRGLAVMGFDAGTRKATNYREIYSHEQRYPGWPFFLPDNQGVIFALGDTADFSGMGAGLLGIASGPLSDLYIVDPEDGTVTLLARAMGFDTPQDAASDDTYLPFGTEDLHRQYYPTVSPVAAGGYFWVFFDSLRHYGNLGLQRQLWGTAVSIAPDGKYGSDPSHPAFYVPGQELDTGNHRAFTALDPCREDGDSCETGIDCCSGFCTDGVCGVPQERCAMTDERCETAGDCCNESDACIGGFCGTVVIE